MTTEEANVDASSMFAAITEADFASVELEEPIAGLNSIDIFELSEKYGNAAQNAREAGSGPQERVYNLFNVLCGFHFKPTDSAETYGPMWVAGTRRSPIPNDLPDGLNTLLADRCADISNPMLRARVADVAWINRRSLAQCATTAIAAYCDCVDGLETGALQLRFDGPHDHTVAEFLRRACQLSAATGWKLAPSDRVRQRIAKSWAGALHGLRYTGLIALGNLDLDYGISSPEAIAKAVENAIAAIPDVGDGFLVLGLWELAARGFHNQRDRENEARCWAGAAECFVKRADTLAAHAFHETHWLSKAIEYLGRAPGSKTRRKELRKRLVDTQKGSADDFATLSNPVDLSEVAASVHGRISGKPLGRALRMFATADKSPTPEQARENALKRLAQSPLSALFATQVLDRGGKVAFQSAGLDSGADDEALRFEIEKQEGIRRGITAQGVIEPARAVINAEHRISVEAMFVITNNSPFVPIGHEYLFALAFARFFNGDFISAASILIPQLENSIRYVLTSSGEDTTILVSDGTQEDRNLSSMFEAMRPSLERLFTPGIVFDLEGLFLFRGGSALRHRFAHGQMPSGAFWSPETIYACWLMFRITCLPLVPHWSVIDERLQELGISGPASAQTEPPRPQAKRQL